MIDTIILTLPRDKFRIADPDKFKPSARYLEKNTNNIKSIQNPTKKELLAGIYKPRLTLQNRINKFGKAELILKIELSLPKLFFGNNFEELKYKDFSKLSLKLVFVLSDMGITTTMDNICKADVSIIHYSKNILLTDGSTPHYFISKIKSANINLALDINQTDYRNEGYSYKWHCNSYEVLFYDKIKELETSKKSSKRSIEKDPAFAFGYGRPVTRYN